MSGFVINPYALAAAAAATSNFAVEPFTADTGGGTQDITTTKLNGNPTACLVVMTHDTAGDGVVAHAGIMTGFASDAVSEYGVYGSSEDNVGTTDNHRGASTTQTVYFLDHNGTTRCAGDVSFITDGIRITWTTTPTAAFKGAVVLMELSDEWVGTTTGTGSQSVTSPGFQPDFMFTGYNYEPGTASDWNLHCFGMACEDSGVKQGSINYADDGNNATSDTWSRTSDDHISDYYNGSWSRTITSFDVNGFTISKSGNITQGHFCGKLKAGDAVEWESGTLSTVGNTTLSHTMTTSRLAIILAQNATSLETDTAGAVYAICVSDGTDTYTLCAFSEDAQATADTGGESANNFTLLTGTGGIQCEGAVTLGSEVVIGGTSGAAVHYVALILGES